MFEDSAAVSRRQFLTQAGKLGAFYSLASAIHLPAFAGSLPEDSRIAQTSVGDAGFASVRKIGDGLYATISDLTRGISTMCNGGFLCSKDAALLIEGFVTPAGAAFQLDTLRKISPVPVTGALDTHYHFDHSLGNAAYAANGIPLWAHADVGKRIVENYALLQGADRATFLAPYEKRVWDAKSDAQKQHAQSDLTAMGNIFDLVNKSALALPNRPLDPAKLPFQLDLGHFPIVLETYPGHSGTDVIVRVPEQKVV
jgi:glyoxylase-like metal-dependent hydrolase (beta-lactamase superfamily II)